MRDRATPERSGHSAGSAPRGSTWESEQRLSQPRRTGPPPTWPGGTADSRPTAWTTPRVGPRTAAIGVSTRPTPPGLDTSAPSRASPTSSPSSPWTRWPRPAPAEPPGGGGGVQRGEWPALPAGQRFAEQYVTATLFTHRCELVLKLHYGSSTASPC